MFKILKFDHIGDQKRRAWLNCTDAQSVLDLYCTNIVLHNRSHFLFLCIFCFFSSDDSQSDGTQRLETILEDKEREHTQNLISDQESGKEEGKTDVEGEKSEGDGEKKEEVEKTESETEKEPQLPTE